MNKHKGRLDMYRYKVCFFDEMKMKERYEEGLCAGPNYSEIAYNLSRFYGEDMLIDMSITCITDGLNPILALDSETVERIKKNQC